MNKGRRVEHPGALIIAWFGGLILIGTGLLLLPISRTATAGTVTMSDAFFTAASAVTVTGLIVNDTATTWSWFGELVLLVLIQVGGLGVMTLAGFFGIALNRKLGIRSGLLAGTEIGMTDLGVLRTLIRDLVRFVVLSELAVAVILTAYFIFSGRFTPLQSVRMGVFHSISAFNNAGFSVFDNGMEMFAGNWFVNIVLAGAFILGGIGFPVVFELRHRWRSPGSWSLHTKVTLWVSALLLLAGTIGLMAVEWSNPATLGAMAYDERLLAAFFQSATARTAGFNTIQIGALRPASWLILVPLMVIGASSASTGGGIKTSTFALVVKSTSAELRRDPTTTLFNRQITLGLQRQSLALLIAALGTVGTAVFLLSVLHPGIAVSELLFEASSAFGTVGISTGVTEHLGLGGRLVVMVLMFLGRVGPITFGTAVLLRPESRRYRYPKEGLLIG